MNTIKKYLGLVWIITAFTAIFYLVKGAINNIKANATLDINKPMPWIIIIIIFIPIAVGLAMFGWYALKGEYEKDAVNN
jgi:thiol:disulfide interchange protein